MHLDAKQQLRQLRLRYNNVSWNFLVSAIISHLIRVLNRSSLRDYSEVYSYMYKIRLIKSLVGTILVIAKTTGYRLVVEMIPWWLNMFIRPYYLPMMQKRVFDLICCLFVSASIINYQYVSIISLIAILYRKWNFLSNFTSHIKQFTS